jgi:hypothetical protein
MVSEKQLMLMDVDKRDRVLKLIDDSNVLDEWFVDMRFATMQSKDYTLWLIESFGPVASSIKCFNVLDIKPTNRYGGLKLKKDDFVDDYIDILLNMIKITILFMAKTLHNLHKKNILLNNDIFTIDKDNKYPLMSFDDNDTYKTILNNYYIYKAKNYIAIDRDNTGLYTDDDNYIIITRITSDIHVLMDTSYRIDYCNESENDKWGYTLRNRLFLLRKLHKEIFMLIYKIK